MPITLKSAALPVTWAEVFDPPILVFNSKGLNPEDMTRGDPTKSLKGCRMVSTTVVKFPITSSLGVISIA